MTIEKKMNGSELEIALEGRLDTMTSPELEAELNQSLAVEEVFEVTGFADILNIVK